MIFVTYDVSKKSSVWNQTTGDVGDAAPARIRYTVDKRRSIMRALLERWLICLVFILPLSTEAHASDTVTKVFATKPDYSVLFVIDGLSYKVWENMDLPNLDRIASDGAKVEKMYLPPAAHPHTGVYARLHTCSIPNPIMMSGTVFINEHTGYLAESFFPARTTAFSVNSLSYQSINRYYHYSYQKDGPDSDAVEWALRFMEEGQPVFSRIHLQQSGGAGSRSLWTNDDVSWRHDIWDADSPYRDAVTRADSLVGVFIDGLGRLGMLEKTAIIVLGDHGQNDSGWHPLEFVDSSITTAVIYGAGVKKGAVIPYAEMIDVVPTICALMDADPPETSQGRVIVEALGGFAGNILPRKMLIKDLLEQFAEYRGKIAEARYLLESIHTGEESALYTRLNNSVDLNFYDIHTFTEWSRFSTLDDLLDNNRKVMKTLDTLLIDIRKAQH